MPISMTHLDFKIKGIVLALRLIASKEYSDEGLSELRKKLLNSLEEIRDKDTDGHSEKAFEETKDEILLIFEAQK